MTGESKDLRSGTSSSSDPSSQQFEKMNTNVKIPSEMNFNGNLANNYQFFKQKFEIYLNASRQTNLDSKYKAALFLNVIGDNALAIYNNFPSEDKTEEKYEELINKFDKYFLPHINVTYERHMFFLRDKKVEETIDEYVNALRGLSSTCEFDNLTDSLIRDRIVMGITDRNLKDTLLRIPNLDLQTAINTCRAAEQSQNQLEKICSSQELNEMSRKNFKMNGNQQTRNFTKKIPFGTRGHPISSSQQNQGNHNKSSFRNQLQFHRQCQRCGQQHQRGKCPAYKAKCNFCNKLNHFSKMCKSKNINLLEKEIPEDTFFLGSIELSQISNDTEWYENLNLNNSLNVKFKLDTGAKGVNILPYHEFKKLKNVKLEKFIGNINTYGNETLTILGTCTLQTKYKDMIENIEFHVMNTDKCAILGLQDIIKFKILTRTNENNIISVISNENTDQDYSKIVSNYNDLFTGIGCLKDEYHIEVDPNVTPIIQPPRKIPFNLHKKLKQKLQELENENIVERLSEPTDWVSSMVIVQKANNDIRICIDPKDLNKAIKREHFHVPSLEELTYELSGAKYFSTLDCSNGFWHVKLDDKSKKLTTFNTPFGRYCFKRLPYGLRNSSEIFFKRISDLFSSIDGIKIYVDDILIFGKSIEEHDKILKKALDICKENNIKLNKNKCKFGITEIKYMGHILSSNGIRPEEEKIKAISLYKTPQNKKDLEIFLGMITYLQRFIPNASTITEPLRNLLKSNIEFQWNYEQQNSFEKLKNIISKEPVLGYFQPNEDIIISCDASSKGLGTCIKQKNKIIAYASRSLTETQQSYAQIEKEMLAVVFSCEKFHQYLFANENITIETDHRPLISIFSKPLVKTPPRLQRMLLKLQPYHFKLVYKPGKELKIADALSRAYINEEYEFNKDIDLHICSLIKNLPVSDSKIEKIRQITKNDDHLQKLVKLISYGFPSNKNNLQDEMKIYWTYRDELTFVDGLIFKGDKILIPKELREDTLKQLHIGHMGKEKMKNRARELIFWPGLSLQIDNLSDSCKTCNLYRKQNVKEPLINHDIPTEPWIKVGLDLFHFNNKNYLIVVDYYSKFIEISNLNMNTTSSNVITNLKSIFSRQGIPKELCSDSGPQFTSSEFKTFANSWDFKHTLSSPHHHQSNGMVERTIQTIKNILKKSLHSGNDPYLALLEYRNTPLSNIVGSPSQLLNSRRLRGILPILEKSLSPEVYDKNKIKSFHKKRLSMGKYYNRNTKLLPKLRINMKVLVRNILNNKWEEGIIVDLHNDRSYIVKLEKNGNLVRRNRKFLRPVKCNFEQNVVNFGNVNDRNYLQNKDNKCRTKDTNSLVDVNAGTRSSGRKVNNPNFLNIKDFKSKSYD